MISSDKEDELNNLTKLATDLGMTKQSDYLLIDDVPKESLQASDIVTAGDFLDTTDDYLLLDVRHPNEITRPAPNKNLINIPFEELVSDYQSLDKNKVIYTLCGSGNRGTAAAFYLKIKGLSPKVIEGGIAAINKALEE